METEKIEIQQNLPKVRANIVALDTTRFEIYCQRDRRKWWRKLGTHPVTDAAFTEALAEGWVEWKKKISGWHQLF